MGAALFATAATSGLVPPFPSAGCLRKGPLFARRGFGHHIRFGLPGIVWEKRLGEVSLQPYRRIAASPQVGNEPNLTNAALRTNVSFSNDS
ncbi:hypothetical protein K4K97_10060 [Phaeobacter inhibens]|uniref:hypothetical protein n=1 Tax=Phaeobacter inhibens TaxID=221822 RepID=UPI0021A475FD|nr:hypothetical protein [Phaeobacter inhibens]UWR78972.1 hypothetical protein K4K97_10060 [Phaeobacter inhibens]